jgi:hypothetical protein
MIREIHRIQSLDRIVNHVANDFRYVGEMWARGALLHLDIQSDG